jgi:hypothetical protein
LLCSSTHLSSHTILLPPTYRLPCFSGPPFQIITLPVHPKSHSKPFMFYNPVTVVVRHNPMFSAQAIVLNTLMFTWVLKIVNAIILFNTTETYVVSLLSMFALN